MARSILIAYTTKKGSTQEVAKAVAATLGEQGLDVAERPAGDVEETDRYDGIVLGGALYVGLLHPDARRFLRRHRQALARLPVAVFAMGPRTTSEEDVAGSGQQLYRELAKFPEVEPFSVAVFGGVVDPAKLKLRFPLSRLPASDARDWEAIRAWSHDLAATFARIAARQPV